jgi:superfamily II DNA or RNA helicase
MLLQARGVRAKAIHSKLPREVRDQRLKAFRSGQLEVLTNVQTLTTGVDIPDIRTILLARPTKSDILHQQMIGRGARLAPGKSKFMIVDMVDSIPQFGAPVVRPRLRTGSAIGYRN